MSIGDIFACGDGRFSRRLNCVWRTLFTNHIGLILNMPFALLLSSHHFVLYFVWRYWSDYNECNLRITQSQILASLLDDSDSPVGDGLLPLLHDDNAKDTRHFNTPAVLRPPPYRSAASSGNNTPHSMTQTRTQRASMPRRTQTSSPIIQLQGRDPSLPKLMFSSTPPLPSHAPLQPTTMSHASLHQASTESYDTCLSPTRMSAVLDFAPDSGRSGVKMLVFVDPVLPQDMVLQATKSHCGIQVRVCAIG